MLSPDQNGGPACAGGGHRHIPALTAPRAGCGEGPGSGPSRVPTIGAGSDPRAAASAPAQPAGVAAAAEGA